MVAAAKGRKMKQFRRIVLIVLDGVGIGALPDAADYGDAGANTLQHVAEACGGLTLPNLQRLGLGNLLPLKGVPAADTPAAGYGRMAEISCGKDSTTGHWELAGIHQLQPFSVFPQGFPAGIIDEFSRRTGLQPLGNVAASGTDILRQLGAEHIRTGRPIVYTSVDSVFQIAAHEEIIPVARLYELCQVAREILNPYRVARVIARPFVGSSQKGFQRTARRHDFSMPPNAETVLDRLQEAGLEVVGVGKIADLFAGRGITRTLLTDNNRHGMISCLKAFSELRRGVLFINLVDFDMLFGHRLDAQGFGRALAEFDAWLPGLMSAMSTDDLLLVTADHGCDPTTPGTDHCREYVPLLGWTPGLKSGCPLGVRSSFADIAATLGENFGLGWTTGKSFLELLQR
jgi:phosphopentomutase